MFPHPQTSYMIGFFSRLQQFNLRNAFLISFDHCSNNSIVTTAIRAVEGGSDSKITAEGSINSLFKPSSDKEDQRPSKISNNISYVNNQGLP